MGAGVARNEEGRNESVSGRGDRVEGVLSFSGTPLAGKVVRKEEVHLAVMTNKPQKVPEG